MSKIQERRQKHTTGGNLPPDDYRPLSKIATQVSVDPSTLARWARGGHIRAQKFGKLWYVHVDDVQHLADEDLHTTDPLRPLREVAAITGIPRRTLRRWAGEGRIEAEKRGISQWYISVEDARRVSETLTPGPKPKYTR